jgi:hypothetical protein
MHITLGSLAYHIYALLVLFFEDICLNFELGYIHVLIPLAQVGLLHGHCNCDQLFGTGIKFPLKSGNPWI